MVTIVTGKATKPATKAPAKRRPQNANTSGQPRGKPPGISTALLREVQTGRGTTATVREVIVNHLALGTDVSVAAARAKVTRTVVWDWLNEGQRLSSAVESGKVTEEDLSEFEREVLRFALDALEAVATAEATALGNVVRLGNGGTMRRRKSTTWRVGKNGDELESRTESEEVLPPDLAANVFVLERRFAERWNRKQQIEITAGDTDPESVPESPLPGLVAMLEAMEARTRETGQALADG